MLAVGRALMSRPRLLILDEPSLGLGPIIVDNLFKILTEINAQGVTILLVEQNAVMALELANRAYVLETGRVTLSGPSRELARDEKVRSAYLGGA
jgi:branched-chain amino acid transport system ATP-binding protein